MTLLEIDRLGVSFRTARGPLHALDGISCAVKDGESIGIVGESGCGKTTLARAILRILPNNAESSGRVLFRGRDLFSLSINDMRKIRWSEMALVTASRGQEECYVHHPPHPHQARCVRDRKRRGRLEDGMCAADDSAKGLHVGKAVALQRCAQVHLPFGDGVRGPDRGLSQQPGAQRSCGTPARSKAPRRRSSSTMSCNKKYSSNRTF